MKTRLQFMAGAVVPLLIATTLAAFGANELKVSGAATIAGNIITPNKAAIEQQAGIALTITVNGDANGLRDLFAGRADVAMSAAPLKVTAEIINKAAPGSINIDGFEVAPVGTLGIKFFVNSANPVKALTEAQLKDIFTGKTTSWKDVGGADLPIIVVTAAPGFATRSNIVASLLGADITDKARVVPALAQIAQIVGQVPNAIGYGNAVNITAALAVIPGTEVEQQLLLVTKGAPSADAKKLIDAAAKLGAALK